MISGTGANSNVSFPKTGSYKYQSVTRRGQPTEHYAVGASVSQTTTGVCSKDAIAYEARRGTHITE
jgi:hypothetical protein